MVVSKHILDKFKVTALGPWPLAVAYEDPWPGLKQYKANWFGFGFSALSFWALAFAWRQCHALSLREHSSVCKQLVRFICVWERKLSWRSRVSIFKLHDLTARQSLIKASAGAKSTDFLLQRITQSISLKKTCKTGLGICVYFGDW